MRKSALALAAGLSLLAAGAVRAETATPEPGSTEDLQQCVAVFGVTSVMADKTGHPDVKLVSDKLFANAAVKLNAKGGSDALTKSTDNVKAIMEGLKQPGAAQKLSETFVACAGRYPAE